MNAWQTKTDASLDLNASNAAVEFDVRDASQLSVSVGLASGSWGSAVVTFERSNNRLDWFGFTTAVTLSAAGIAFMDVGDCRWVRARVSTVNGSALTARVTDYQSDTQPVSVSVSAGGLSDGDMGDITVGGSGTTLTIDNDAVTYAKMQNISATQRALGRNSGGAGDTEEVTASQLLDWVGSTRGAVLYRGASGWAILAPGTAGFFLQSQGSGADPAYASGWTVIRKTADETRTSTTTLADDGELVLAMEANTKYRFRISVFFVTHGTPEFKYALDGPASPTQVAIRQFHVNPSSSGNTNFVVRSAEIGSTATSGGGSDPGYIVLDGVWHNGANAGNLAFQWAQVTSSGNNTTVLALSTLEWFKV